MYCLAPLLAFCDRQDDPCASNDNPPCDSLATFQSKILWYSPIMADTSEISLDEITIAGDRFFYVRNKEGYAGTITAREINTGKLFWEWGDVNISSGSEITSIKVADGKLIVESWASLFVIDIQTGTTIWASNPTDIGSCGSPRMNVLGNQIYFVIEDCSIEKKYTALMRTPISHFAPEQILKIEEPIDTNWVSGLEPPSLFIGSTGDSLLIFQNRAFRLGSNKDEVELFAYNLNSKSLLWKIDSLTLEGTSSVNLPIVQGGFVYAIGIRSIHKIDAMSGQRVWSKSFPINSEHFISSNITIAENVIFAHPGSNNLYALSAETGSEIWRIGQLGCCGVTGEIQYIDQHLYYVTPPFFLDIDTEKAKIVSKNESPLKWGNARSTRFAQFTQTISSPDNKLLITSDDHYIMAIKVN